MAFLAPGIVRGEFSAPGGVEVAQIALLFALSVLACWRLAHMFAKESGPGRAIKKARQSTPKKSIWREGVECVLCESVWWSGVLSIYLSCVGFVGPQVLPVWWLAVSGGAILVNRTYERLGA